MSNFEGGHGHVTPRADGMKARCGGPGLCPACSIEQAAKQQAGQKNTGWFAELVPEGLVGWSPECPWLPVLQLAGHTVALAGPWFRSKSDCERWLADFVAGQGMLRSG